MTRPSIGLIQKHFGYDPERGILIRKIKHRYDLPDEVYPQDKRVLFERKRYTYTHIIWVVHYGKWPTFEIDHIDRDTSNNRINNLRDITHTQNIQNRAGFGSYAKGISYDSATFRRKPWVARISIEGKSTYLGNYATKPEAQEAYILAALEYHGDFACLE